MILFAKVMMNWFLLDVLIAATVWYTISTIKPLTPNWWEAHVCGKASDYFD